MPLFYHPEKAKDAWGASLAEGASHRSAALPTLDVTATVPLFIGEHADAALAAYRANIALYVGGMGARGANFYNDLATRYGYEDAAKTVQELYRTGRKEEATAALPEELVVGTSLIGTESHVRERVRALLDAGVTTFSATLLAPTAEGRIENARALAGIVKELTA